jgi:hypothetical protein
MGQDRGITGPRLAGGCQRLRGSSRSVGSVLGMHPVKRLRNRISPAVILVRDTGIEKEHSFAEKANASSVIAANRQAPRDFNGGRLRKVKHDSVLFLAHVQPVG